MKRRPTGEQEEKFLCYSLLSFVERLSDTLWRNTACFLHIFEDTNKQTLHWLDKFSQASKPHMPFIDLLVPLADQSKSLHFLRLGSSPLILQPSSLQVPDGKKTWALSLGMHHLLQQHTKNKNCFLHLPAPLYSVT